ncbi:MAG: ABC transporter ATP-binding protein [Paraclostridium sp.]|uniref:ABC transporter ATP-binding protein n=1 Tax=Paraclostridium sp. TaxID=2023273 RepID=UPI003F3A372C
MSAVKIIELVKTFNNTEILKHINLDIKQGEFITLLGKSGCGKSTTLKLIAGLTTPDSGDILFDNKSVLNLKTQDREAVIVFQDYSLFPHMNVFENIEFGLKMKKIDRKVRKNKVNELMNLVKLQGFEKKYPNELSGGQKQRVAIARTLAVNPKILLLDEPFSSLDINLKNEMRDFILNLQKKLKITTILVTHDKEEALMMSDKIAVMINGEIAQFDIPKNLYEKPNSKEVANIFGQRNYIRGRIKNGVYISDILNLELKCNEENIENIENIELMISKEDIEIHSNSYEIGISGNILKKVYSGDITYYDVNIKNTVMKLSSRNSMYEVGENVKLSIVPKNTIYFSEN